MSLYNAKIARLKIPLFNLFQTKVIREVACSCHIHNSADCLTHNFISSGVYFYDVCFEFSRLSFSDLIKRKNILMFSIMRKKTTIICGSTENKCQCKFLLSFNDCKFIVYFWIFCFQITTELWWKFYRNVCLFV